MFPVSWEKILQQFVAFWTQIKLACFVPPEFEISNSNKAMKSSLAVLFTLAFFSLHPFVTEVYRKLIVFLTCECIKSE